MPLMVMLSWRNLLLGRLLLCVVILIVLLLLKQLSLLSRVRSGSGHGLQGLEIRTGRTYRGKVLLLVMIWHAQLPMDAFQTSLGPVLSIMPVVLELLLSVFKASIGLRALSDCR
jgi:hypothetical protein